MTTSNVRWGILGTGRIAGKFARDIGLAPGAELVAVGSRTAEAARAFSGAHGIPRAHATYEALASDPQVDAIYIATPHPMHVDNALLCAQAGKHALVEKTFSMTADEAARMIAAARQRGTFLMEAMWTRFLPAIVALREMVAVGRLGQVRALSADLGFRAPRNPADRLLNPALGGGTLLDVGIYTVSFASLLFGAPRRVDAQAWFGDTGVDEQHAILLGYEDGRQAVLAGSFLCDMPVEAHVMGSDARVRVHSRFHHPTRLSLVSGDRYNPGERVLEYPFEGGGFQFQIEHASARIRAGHLESDVMPLDETLQIMRTLDRIRAVWGGE